MATCAAPSLAFRAAVAPRAARKATAAAAAPRARGRGFIKKQSCERRQQSCTR